MSKSTTVRTIGASEIDMEGLRIAAKSKFALIVSGEVTQSDYLKHPGQQLGGFIAAVKRTIKEQQSDSLVVHVYCVGDRWVSVFITDDKNNVKEMYSDQLSTKMWSTLLQLDSGGMTFPFECVFDREF